MATGRPKITPADFEDGWQLRVLEEFSEGATKLEVSRGVLDIDKETFARLVAEDESFSAVIKKGLELSEVWWTRKGRQKLGDKDFSYVGWYMNMKNRFGWRDRQDITSNDKEIPAPIFGGVSATDKT